MEPSPNRVLAVAMVAAGAFVSGALVIGAWLVAKPSFDWPLAIGYALMHSFAEASYGTLAVCGLVQGIVYWAGVSFAGFNASDRAFFAKVFKQALPFSKKPQPILAEAQQ